MTNFIYVAVSLDGFIAEVDGGLDWLSDIPNPDRSDFGFANFLNGIDAVVMGRNTFLKIVEMGEWIYTKPVFVLSHSLDDVPAGFEKKATIVQGDVTEMVKRLNGMGLENLYVDGGKTVQQFLRHDLIDEMIISQVPILLGDGISLFDRIGVKRAFSLVHVDVLNEKLVKQHFRRGV